MSKRTFDLEYIEEQGLHDTVIERFFIDFKNRQITMKICGFTERQNKVLNISLSNVSSLRIQRDNKLREKNEEIILDFSVNEHRDGLRIYTASDTTYEIYFDSCVGTIEKSV